MSYPVGNYVVEFLKLNNSDPPIDTRPFWCNQPSNEYFDKLAREYLNSYWDELLKPTTTHGPIPEIIRIISPDGREVRRWSIMDKLNELDTTNVEPMAQVLFDAGETATLRADVEGPTLTNQEAVANAALTGGGYFKVPRVIER